MVLDFFNLSFPAFGDVDTEVRLLHKAINALQLRSFDDVESLDHIGISVPKRDAAGARFVIDVNVPYLSLATVFLGELTNWHDLSYGHFDRDLFPVLEF